MCSVVFTAPPVKGSGISGVLYAAEPLDACSTLTNKVEQASNTSSPFVLITRGECSFEDKVRRAQKAGFKAAIVYDDKDGGILVASMNFSCIVNFVLLHLCPWLFIKII